MIYVDDPDFTLHVGDVRDVLRTLPDASVDCVVTSPPYFGLRDYGTASWDGGDPACDHRHETAHQKQGVTSQRVGRQNADEQRNENFRDVCGKCGARRADSQIGMEATPQAYVAAIVDVFREVRRVLSATGTVWLNLGDSYAGSTTAGAPRPGAGRADGIVDDRAQRNRNGIGSVDGLKTKDLVGIPWRVAFALQDDGWYLRSDIIWSKPNPMPESVTDRPTKAHEYVFLLSQQPSYYFDQDAVRERFATTHAPGSAIRPTHHYADTNGGNGGLTGHLADVKARLRDVARPQVETLDGSDGEAPRGPDGRRQTGVQARDGSLQHRDGERWPNEGRNIRSVWEIATQPYAGAHFATYPEELVRRCIAAGCPAGGVVLDPFMGSGTTALVARKLGRRSVGIELNPDYARLCADRLQQLSLLA